MFIIKNSATNEFATGKTYMGVAGAWTTSILGAKVFKTAKSARTHVTGRVNREKLGNQPIFGPGLVVTYAAPPLIYSNLVKSKSLIIAEVSFAETGNYLSP